MTNIPCLQGRLSGPAMSPSHHSSGDYTVVVLRFSCCPGTLQETFVVLHFSGWFETLYEPYVTMSIEDGLISLAPATLDALIMPLEWNIQHHKKQ